MCMTSLAALHEGESHAVINATTHTGAERALGEHVAPVRRIGPHAFVTLLGLELVLVVGVLVWALTSLVPPATPLAQPADITPVEEAIRARVIGEVVDPLIELGPGLSARSSNVRGFSLNGATYYYYVEGSPNFDPYSRGIVGAGEIEILRRDSSGPSTVVIYRLL